MTSSTLRPAPRRAAAALVASLGGIVLGGLSLPAAAQQASHAFDLIDHTGKPFSSRALAGQPYAIFFGFTHCPDVCPTTLLEMSNDLAALGPDGDRLKVLFVSVDGERDTPASLKEYLGRLSPDFIGLTGDPDAVRAIAEGFHAAFYKDTPAADASYKVEHSGQIYLVDAQGQLRAELYDPPVETITTLVRTLP